MLTATGMFRKMRIMRTENMIAAMLFHLRSPGGSPYGVRRFPKGLESPEGHQEHTEGDGGIGNPHGDIQGWSGLPHENLVGDDVPVVVYMIIPQKKTMIRDGILQERGGFSRSGTGR